MTIPKVPIEKINKMPLAYALMILGGLLGVVASKYFDRNTEIIEAYKQKDAARDITDKIKDQRCDSVARFWQNKYVGALEQKSEEARKADSVYRAKLTQPNEEFIRVIKKTRK